jgi:hypothetical protein
MNRRDLFRGLLGLGGAAVAARMAATQPEPEVRVNDFNAVNGLNRTVMTSGCLQVDSIAWYPTPSTLQYWEPIHLNNWIVYRDLDTR